MKISKDEQVNRTEATPTRTKRKMWGRAAAIVALCAMLAVTTYALQLPSVTVANNLFQMGQVDIDLGQGQAIFNASNGTIEPGETLVEEFTIENVGDVDVYYRLYLERVKGELKDQLEFSIYHGDQILFQGKAQDLTLYNPCKDSVPLAPGESRTLCIQAYLPETAGNDAQDQSLQFDLKVEGVQARNNDQQEFE